MTCLDIVCFFEVHQSNMDGKQHRHEFRDWNICCNLKHLQGLTGLRWKCLILPLTVVTNSRFLSRLRWRFWILPQSALSFKLISAFYILASVSDIFKQKPSLRAWGAFCCSRSILWEKKKPHRSYWKGDKSGGGPVQVVICIDIHHCLMPIF